jgi:DNA-binding CsgD family transcriptional regulator
MGGADCGMYSATIDAPLPTDCQDRRNERILGHLVAWAEILSALGWSVALRLPGKPHYLSRGPLPTGNGEALSWEKLNARLAGMPANRFLVSTDDARIWSETPPCHESADATGPAGALSKREKEVLDWLLEGKTGPDIATILGCSRRTVENHINRLYGKLGVRTRAQLLFSVRKPGVPDFFPPSGARRISRLELKNLSRVLDFLPDAAGFDSLTTELRALEERCRLLSIWTSLARPLYDISGFRIIVSDAAPFLGAKDARVLAGLIQGESREAIALQLHWRRDTLDRHLGQLRERLGFENLSQLLQAFAALKTRAQT